MPNSPCVSRADNGDVPCDFFDADVLFLNVPPGRRLADVEERYGALMRRVAALLRAAPVRRVVFASSTSVYPNLGREVTEDDVFSCAELLVQELDTPRRGRTQRLQAGLQVALHPIGEGEGISLLAKHHPPRRCSTILWKDHSTSTRTPRRWNT